MHFTTFLCPKNWILIGVLVLGLHAVARAQDPDDDVIRTDTSLVQLNIGVVDKQGRPITSLTKGDFSVVCAPIRDPACERRGNAARIRRAKPTGGRRRGQPGFLDANNYLSFSTNPQQTSFRVEQHRGGNVTVLTDGQSEAIHAGADQPNRLVARSIRSSA